MGPVRARLGTRSEGRLIAVAPLRLECHAGFRVLRFIGKGLSPYIGFLHAPEHPDAETRLLEGLARHGRHWDVYPDQRSQVYGGCDDETDKSRAAVDQTAGIVVAFGPSGRERIFKTYFSACCGGVTQSAADAFNEPYKVPLSDQNLHGLCSAADNYSWGPVEISKAELTRRLREFGKRRMRGEKDMAMVSSLEIQLVNRFDRPIRFAVTDANSARYSLTSEELRVAVNSGTTKEQPARLLSSFVKVICDPGSDVVRFVEGHGNGHGVGMCQWCSEIRSEAGMGHEDIVLSSYPRAKLVRAY